MAESQPYDIELAFISSIAGCGSHCNAQIQHGTDTVVNVYGQVHAWSHAAIWIELARLLLRLLVFRCFRDAAYQDGPVQTVDSVGVLPRRQCPPPKERNADGRTSNHQRGQADEKAESMQIDLVS